jgi:hypothetical protein
MYRRRRSVIHHWENICAHLEMVLEAVGDFPEQRSAKFATRELLKFACSELRD